MVLVPGASLPAPRQQTLHLAQDEPATRCHPALRLFPGPGWQLPGACLGPQEAGTRLVKCGNCGPHRGLGEASNVHDLRTSHRNVAVYSCMADSLAARGHMRTREQVCCKIKDLQQSYSKACQPGADLETCPHFEALDRILGAHAVHAPRVVFDPGAEGPVSDTEEEEEDVESQQPAGSLPKTQDPRGIPQSTSAVSSEAEEGSTSAAPGTAGRTTPPATATCTRASRHARNQEEYQQRHLRVLEHQLHTQDHWVREDLQLRQRSLEALEEHGRALRGHLQTLVDRFLPPPAPAPAAVPALAPPPTPAPPSASSAPPVPPAPPFTPTPPRRPHIRSAASQESQQDPHA
ncbi:uncharacterized protein LOC142819579 [Pelodiscus sinensis]|uniref:uncharacterized protein LOC142819579 n=1 Tax=Pelodiscus sinensis TaxID=13735 RepID=UPI003F6A70E6